MNSGRTSKRVPESPPYKYVPVRPEVHERVRKFMHRRELRSLGEAVDAALSEAEA